MGILAIVVAFLLFTVEPDTAPSVLLSGFIMLVSGPIFRGLGVVAEAAEKYLDSQEKE